MRPKADPDMSTENTEHKGRRWPSRVEVWKTKHEKEMLELEREERCQHHDSGRGVCVECGAFL
jgi:hypothetical protein